MAAAFEVSWLQDLLRDNVTDTWVPRTVGMCPAQALPVLSCQARAMLTGMDGVRKRAMARWAGGMERVSGPLLVDDRGWSRV